ncbi:MAG: MraY family glycosyltransferase [Armatimonadota bacterium]|nr:undecaprenyl/decaprenyl-phosphate alpha-N-acetylglucosaminyl 1-phosphate transferase [Armatimonadota bacterium]MDW8156018.1 MraY family glycosyltransferase [Armatimonadota bacterium]
MSIPPYVVAGLVAWFVTYWTTPTARWLARRVGAVDYPGGRRINRRPLPRLGGLAIVSGVLVASALSLPMPGAVAVAREPKHLVLAVPYGAVPREFWGILLGGLAIALVGLYDDLRQVSGRVKFPLVYLAATVPVLFGLTTPFVTNPVTGQLVSLGVWGQVFTVAWVGSAAIAMNSIDGMDGLAAGIAAIAAGTFFVAGVLRGAGLPTLVVCAAVAGSAVGFLRYNFNPARVIMGDGGALFLGYLLGALSVAGLFKTLTFLSLAVPLLALGVPIFDTAFAILRRVRRRVSVFQPDRGHVHHRLLDRGLSQRQAVLLLYGTTALLSSLSLALSGWVERWIPLSVAGLLGVALWVVARRLGLLARTP